MFLLTFPQVLSKKDHIHRFEEQLGTFLELSTHQPELI